MIDKIKKYLKFLFIVLAICLPLMLIPVVKADSGWDSDYDSGGSWDSDWDSGSSWDSDWDSGSSWSSDDDWDSDGSSSSGGMGIIGFLIFVSIFYFVIKAEIDRINRRNGYGSNSLGSGSLYQDVTNEKITALLPNETVDSLKIIAYDTFIAVQNAWMDFDYDKLRELCTDELYNSYVSQLKTLKIKYCKNVMKSFVKHDIKITDIKKVNDSISINVYLYVEFYDYVINEKTKSITRGSSNMKISNRYMMTFVKGDTKNEDKCPNCGADIKANVSGVCEYCNSTIVKKPNTFVLSKKTNLNK